MQSQYKNNFNWFEIVVGNYFPSFVESKKIKVSQLLNLGKDCIFSTAVIHV